MVEVEKTDYDLLSGYLSSNGQQVKNLIELGKRLGSRFKAVGHDRVHVVSTAEDIDLITLGFLYSLQKRDIGIGASCFWNAFHKSDLESLVPSISPVIGQFHDRLDGPPPSLLVNVASSLYEHATVATNLTRLAATYPAADLLICCPIPAGDIADDLANQFKIRGRAAPPVYNLPSLANVDDIDNKNISAAVRQYTLNTFGPYTATFHPEFVADREPLLSASSSYTLD